MGEKLVRLELLVLLACGWDVMPTRSTFPFPLSFTLITKDSSNPVVGSVKVRKAWCGRFAAPPSRVVRVSLNESVPLSDTDLANGLFGLKLWTVSTKVDL